MRVVLCAVVVVCGCSSNGPILMQDTALIDKLAHFDRERIPERVVHAKGAGAHGYFEVTADVSKYSRAKVFSKIGKVRRCDDGSDNDARRAAISSSCTAAAASPQTAAK